VIGREELTVQPEYAGGTTVLELIPEEALAEII
jgi:hypothetical protein